MASPSSFFEPILQRIGQMLQPPPWLVDEMQRRVVLSLNHVLQQEPEAQARLKRQAGRLVEAHWRGFSARLLATPAGLLDLGPATQMPDLTLTLTDESPWSLAQSALRGEKPAIRIAGDVQLAAEVQWLVDHVRWDIEEDLARVIGDAPAHALATVGRRMADAVRQFAGRAPGAAPGAGTTTGMGTPGMGTPGMGATPTAGMDTPATAPGATSSPPAATMNPAAATGAPPATGAGTPGGPGAPGQAGG